MHMYNLKNIHIYFQRIFPLECTLIPSSVWSSVQVALVSEGNVALREDLSLRCGDDTVDGHAGVDALCKIVQI